MTANQGNDLVITRIFDAPKELVWKAWTDPERIMKWWGPKMFTVPHCRIDLRVGGSYLLCMRDQDGKNFWTTGVYEEIVPFDRLVHTDCFADENGNIIPASYYGMPGDDWPLAMKVILVFEDLKGKTKMTLRHIGLPGATMSEMTGTGWNESFDKLAESLK